MRFIKKIKIQVRIAIIFILAFSMAQEGCTQDKNIKINMGNKDKYKNLTKEEERVILFKGTEAPFTGKYENFWEEGIYECKRCGSALYRSDDKFDAECGWPSFDDAIYGAVSRLPDKDGKRTEIVCSNCGGHLGHVFTGEKFTDKNTRHCVNSVSMNFVSLEELNRRQSETETAIFAGGCFWGVEYYMGRAKGVLKTEVGYINSNKPNPTYEEVCSGTTGAAEAIRVLFKSGETTYEELAKLFFEIHDPTQVNRQGPDIGEQYRSEVFYLNEKQKEEAENLIGILKGKGLQVATKVTKAGIFWKAEDYHQQYYNNNGHKPYCHGYTKRF